MSNPVPVTIQGLSGSKAGSGGATVLTQAQANQLVQQLRSIQGSGASGGSGTQAIKIHAIQTNPTTGARQIVVIPSSSGSASNTSSSGIQIANTSRIVQHVQQSPGKKVIKIQAAAATAPGSSNSSTSFHHTPINQADMPPGVKVVKISTASGTQPGQVRTVYSPQVGQEFLTKTSKVNKDQKIFVKIRQIELISEIVQNQVNLASYFQITISLRKIRQNLFWIITGKWFEF